VFDPYDPFGPPIPRRPKTTAEMLSELLSSPVAPVAASEQRMAFARALMVGSLTERFAYFAFDFDDILRANNVRNNGKIGPRVNGNSRGFKDRSVWEKSNARTKRGLRQFMQKAVEQSGVVCALIGTTTWQSFWVRYEIALSVIGGRGLLAVDVNSINHSDETGPDPLGVNPLHFIGVYKDGENWRLVERKMVETAAGPELKWGWYNEHTSPVKRPLYIPDVANTVMPLSSYAGRFDFMRQSGSQNMCHWFDTAARNAGR
jgi:MTH538 TIR-like domain (DUF1863)